VTLFSERVGALYTTDFFGFEIVRELI